MINTESIDYHHHLPSYRSLLNPSVKYDYQTHSFIPLSQNDINSWSNKLKAKDNQNLTFAKLKSKSQRTSDGIKMKYRSMLEDVSRSLSLRLTSNSITSNSSILNDNYLTFNTYRSKLLPLPPRLFDLPSEIIEYIFNLVDDTQSYKSCLFTCKDFYCSTKPFYYHEIKLDSTYRVAQFVSLLRLNKSIGQYVTVIDLSGLKPGYDEDLIHHDVVMNENDRNHTHPDDNTLETDDFNIDQKVLAGWRDWKFKNNPLYSMHSNTSTNLTKIVSNSQHYSSSIKSQNSSSSLKFKTPFQYLRRRKRRRSSVETVARSTIYHEVSEKANSHPFMNKYLLNYSTSKDLPVGYILHLINLCPNIRSLNLGNLSLSSDYQINPKMIYKYQTFDLMNNYSKDMVSKIDKIMYKSIIEEDDVYSNLSSSSSVYSIATFSKPIPKYNSLLPPLPQTVTDFSYLKKGDGKVYLSDLNLKSINNNYLSKVDEQEILNTILKIHTLTNCHINNRMNSNFHNQVGNLKYIELSSMIWLNKSFVRDFLAKFIEKKSNGRLESIQFDDEEDEDEEDEFNNHQMHLQLKEYKQSLILDFTDSGMYKLLPWAKRLDLNTYPGCKLAYRIINGILFDPFDEFVRRERIRRGRMGENYVS